MKRHILSLIAIGLVIALGSSVAVAGNTNDGATKKNTKVSALKKGEQPQGTFAYRFDTYSGYTGEVECNAATSPNCASSLNDDLRDGSSPAFPKANSTDTKKPAATVEKADTPTNK